MTVATIVPADFPVQPLAPDAPAKVRVTDGVCGLSWDDGIGTEWTPAPSGRCPFEYFHEEEEEEEDLTDIDDALAEIRQLLAARTDADEPSRLADLIEAVDAYMSNGAPSRVTGGPRVPATSRPHRWTSNAPLVTMTRGALLCHQVTSRLAGNVPEWARKAVPLPR